MPSIENDPETDSARTRAEYNAMGREYDEHNASNPVNAYYERPTTIGLLGDVAGLHVLEAGCGSGPLTKWLVDSGASVTAFDVSPGMLDLARQRVGDKASLELADAAEPLRFADSATFDLVVASLVLHYIRDLRVPLSEFRRVLRPTGSAVLSMHHPSRDWLNHSPDDYFAVKQVSEVWVDPHPVTFWRRPLTDITGAIKDAGFVIETLVEGQPHADLAELDADSYAELAAEPFLIHLRLRPLQEDGSVTGVAGQGL